MVCVFQVTETHDFYYFLLKNKTDVLFSLDARVGIRASDDSVGWLVCSLFTRWCWQR